jgi:hypothetical protein
MAKDLRDRQKQAPFDPALPHLDRRPFERGRPEEIGLGIELLDVAADGDRFVDHGPVIEFEQRDRLKGIESGEVRSLMLKPGEVDLDQGDRDALLREKDADPTRIRRELGVVEFQPVLPGVPRTHGGA